MSGNFIRKQTHIKNIVHKNTITLTDAPAAKTHSVTELIMVGLNANNNPIDVEFAMNFDQVSEKDRMALSQAYPSLSEAIRDHLRQETEFVNGIFALWGDNPI
ncbi:MAG: hypothetical protein M1483_03345 [Actinobacteria bacterium]|nr:hypothetical protein [Actinomycetota bacterium]MCL6104661.1 hypothetical protein [Actinomycetota bacterium]